MSEREAPQQSCPFKDLDKDSRVNLLGRINHLKENGVIGAMIEDDNLKEAFDRIRAESYSLAALLIPETLGYSLSQRENRGPFGLLTPYVYPSNNSIGRQEKPLEQIGGGYRFGQIKDSMRFTLLTDLKDQTQRLSANRDDEDSKLLLDAQYKLNMITVKFAGKKTVNEFIGAGTNTASEVMTNTLQVITEIMPKGETPEEDSEIFRRVAEKNWHIIGQIARQNITLFSSLLYGLRGDHHYNTHVHVPFEAERFSIDQNERLRIDNEFLEEKIAQHIERQKANPRPTLSCPAMYSGEIKKLWNWHVDVVDQVMYKGEQNGKR